MNEEASPSPICCPDSAWGALVKENDKQYTPSGTVEKLCNGSLDVYVSKPKSSIADKVLLVIGDVHGWTNRVKSFCDLFATKGYVVMMPDLFHGETKSYNSEPSFLDWMKKFNYTKKLKLEVESCISHAKSILAEEEKILSVDGLGFCFGAWVFMKACSDPESNISFTRVAVVHPSFYIESRVYGEDEVPLVKAALSKTVWLMLASEDEPENCQNNGEIFNAINATAGGKARSFTEMRHGWVSRGDFNDPKVQGSALDALNEIDRFLS